MEQQIIKTLVLPKAIDTSTNFSFSKLSKTFVIQIDAWGTSRGLYFFRKDTRSLILVKKLSKTAELIYLCSEVRAITFAIHTSCYEVNLR